MNASLLFVVLARHCHFTDFTELARLSLIYYYIRLLLLTAPCSTIELLDIKSKILRKLVTLQYKSAYKTDKVTFPTFRIKLSNNKHYLYYYTNFFTTLSTIF